MAAAWGLARYLMTLPRGGTAHEHRDVTTRHHHRARLPDCGEREDIGIHAERGTGRAADDPGHEVAFEHHRRAGTSGKCLLDRLLVAGDKRSSRPARDDVRVQHPG